ncbi:MAG: hypothetical protein Q9184_003461, partial [Pyrenodesmia sp. 2 TL-2023]
MPRKAFVEDLQQAIGSFNHPKISRIEPGVEDGSLTFQYALPSHGGVGITLQALVTDVGEYPSSHTYMIYTTSDNIPAHVSNEIEDVGTLDGLRVSDMLSKVTKRLDNATADSQQEPLELDDDAMDCDGASTGPSEPELEEDSDADSIGAWSPNSPPHPTLAAITSRK